MAIDLLRSEPTKHLYRHDLESLFYVIVVLTTRYHEGNEVPGNPKGKDWDESPPLQAWFSLGMEDLKEKKVAFLSFAIPTPTSGFLDIKDWTEDMSQMLQDGFIARKKHEANADRMNRRQMAQNIPAFEEETLGGNIDFDKFWQILDMIDTSGGQ